MEYTPSTSSHCDVNFKSHIVLAQLTLIPKTLQVHIWRPKHDAQIRTLHMVYITASVLPALRITSHMISAQ